MLLHGEPVETGQGHLGHPGKLDRNVGRQLVERCPEMLLDQSAIVVRALLGRWQTAEGRKQHVRKWIVIAPFVEDDQWVGLRVILVMLFEQHPRGRQKIGEG